MSQDVRKLLNGPGASQALLSNPLSDIQEARISWTAQALPSLPPGISERGLLNGPGAAQALLSNPLSDIRKAWVSLDIRKGVA